MAALHGDEKARAIFDSIIRTCGVKAAVETGTFHGDTSRWFAERVDRVWTCEVRRDFFDQRAAAEGPNDGRIEWRWGQSQDLLDPMINEAFAFVDTADSVLVFLDAHWQDDWPLRRELEIVNGWGYPNGHSRRIVVVVDDFQVPGHPNFSAPEGGGGTPGHAMYGPRKSVDRTPASIGTFMDEMSPWTEWWFPCYSGTQAGYVILSNAPLAEAMAGHEVFAQDHEVQT